MGNFHQLSAPIPALPQLAGASLWTTFVEAGQALDGTGKGSGCSINRQWRARSLRPARSALRWGGRTYSYALAGMRNSS